MKKKFTMLLAALFLVMGAALAQTAYTVSATTGTANKSGYFATWSYTTSDANPAALKLAVQGGANNMQIADEQLELWVGSGSTYTLQVPVFYRIVSYSFDFVKVSDYSETVTLTVDGKEYNPTMEPQSVTVNNINQSSTAFKLTGANKGIKVTNFVVNVDCAFEVTTDENNPIWHTIKNVRGNVYAYNDGDSRSIGLSNVVANGAYLFYFTAGTTEGTYKIHSYATSKKCADFNSWTDAGIDWYITPSANTEKPGWAITKNADRSGGWNNAGNSNTYVAGYSGDDIGSTWEIARYDYASVLPTVLLSTENNVVLHYIRSIRRDSYVNFDGHNVTFKEGNLGLASYWYFVQDEEAQKNAPAGFLACRIFNAAHATGVENYTSGFMGTDSWPARVYYIGMRANERHGYVIYRADETGNQGWHDYGGTYIGAYGMGDNGSLWRIYPADKTEEQLKPEAATAKTNALNTIAVYEEADYYAYLDENIATAKTTINAVTNDNLLNATSGWMAINAAMATLEASEKGSTAPVAGDYIQLKNKHHNKYLKALESDAEGVDSKADLATIWEVVVGANGNVKLKNVSTEKYIGQVRESATVAMTDEANAAEFSWTNQDKVYAVFKDVTGDNYAYGHVNGGKLVGWSPDAASSQWVMSQIYPLSVVYKYNGTEIAEHKVETYLDKEATYTINNPYADTQKYVTIGTCTAIGSQPVNTDGVWSVTVTEATVVTVNLVDNLPFKISTDFANANWQYLQMNSSAWKYMQKNENDDKTSKADVSSLGDRALWAFVGDAINGFKILNKGAEGAVLTVDVADDGTVANEAAAYMKKDGDQTWTIEKGNGGFIIRQGTTECLNDFEGGGVMKVWKADASPSGAGSAFRTISGGVKDLSTLYNSKIYVLQAERSQLLYDASAPNKLSSGMANNIAVNGNDANQQFMIIRPEDNFDGKYYLYNVGAAKFVDANLNFTDYPELVLSFEENEGNPVFSWFVKIGGKYVVPGAGGTAGNKIYHTATPEADAGKWYRIEEVDINEDLASLVNKRIEIAEYKAAAKTALENLSGVCSLVGVSESLETAKTAIDAIATTDYTTFSAIDAEVEKVTDAIAARKLTFQTCATDYHRENVWMSANMTTKNSIGLHGEKSYNSIWSLRHADGVTFYLYNELNSVYMGKPSDNCPLTETPSVAYTFEMIPSEVGNVVEMHTNNETLHASNHDDDKLLNWDGNEAASRWMVAIIDAAKDIQDLLESVTSEDYAETPNLGQFPKAAYDALVDAKTSAETIEEVANAIAAFKASKNLPVFTISNGDVKDYAVGKSIYDDNSGTLYFKTTNLYDKTMWWALDQTTTTVGVTDKVGIYNVGTGNGFWGASSIKVTETTDAVEGEDDGLFLFYTTGNNTPIHFQADYSQIVRWGSTEATSGSAAKFTYIGNTYDLKKLTDAHVEAKTALQAVYAVYASYEDDEFTYNATPNLGQYAVSADAFKEALVTVKGYANATVSDLAKADVDAMTAAAETLEAKAAELFASKNLPVFTISNGDVKDYAVGKSIYDDNSGTLYFKTTNLYDKTMWWALDQTTTTVGVTDKVGIYNVGTGNGFWGASSIKVTETTDAVEGEDDGLFLFYTTGNNTPIHFQADYSQIVRWGSTEATSGSAAKFTYIGNTYDLKKLTDAHVEAKTALQAVYAVYASYEDDEFTYNATPNLGQYAVSADAFKEALVTVKGYANATVSDLAKAGVDAMTAAAETLEAKAAELFASKNLPVFTISNGDVKDYAVGKSIYDDNSGTLYFKTTNLYDKTMWWALDQTTTTVGVTDKVGIYNVGTGNGFWGASSIKVTETSDAVEGEDDGLFLFYTTGNNTPIHFQNTNSEIVRWSSSEATSGSAAKFTYIGNTYDLNKLPKECFDAATELAAVTVPNFNFATGVNYYDEATKPALYAAIANRADVMGRLASVDEIAAAKTQLVEAISGVQINMPKNGKFYRVRCAGDGMKRLQSTINNDRLQMIGDEAGINASSIFCYVNGSLLSYTTGLYINAYNFDAVGKNSTVTFSKAYNGALGQYNIKINDSSRYIYGKKSEIDSGTGDPADNGYNWWLEEVTTLPVTVASIGYATLFAPVALQRPVGVNVYVGKVDEDCLILTPINGNVIPANTGVLIEADPNTYTFPIVENVKPIEPNAFTGSYAKSVKNPDKKVYTLQNGKNGVGFYLFKGYKNENDKEVTKTYINGFRSWVELPLSASAQGLRIRKEGTNVEDVELENELFPVIYDLMGRRVEKMDKGIYIVNGKKILVK